MTEPTKLDEVVAMEEKQKIFDILKFTPVDYTFSVFGYGGTSRFLKASKEQYKYFQDNEIDIEDYAGWDCDAEVPEDMQPFPPGQSYDGYEVDCAAGATMDDASWLVVTDENDNEVFRCTLNTDQLDDESVETEEVGGFDPEYDCAKGTVLIWAGDGEKGTFYHDSIRMTKPFDPKLLKVTYQDFDGWLMLSSVEYDGEELSDGGLSTTGKWAEHRWVIIGGDEAFDEVSEKDAKVEVRDKEDPIPETTDWYPKDIKPVRNGFYECTVDGVPSQAWPFATFHMIEWKGKKWDTKGTVTAWRGLKEEAK